MGPTQDQNQPIQTPNPINKPKIKTKTFVSLVLIVLLVAGASVFAWTKTNQDESTVNQDTSAEGSGDLPKTATMTVEANKDAVKVGTVVDFAVYVDSGETETNAVSVVASFPTDTFELVDITYEGGKFDIQAEESTKNGTITLERGATKPVMGRALVATIKLSPTKARTDGALSLEEKSSLLATLNAQNILGERNEAQIEIAGE